MHSVAKDCAGSMRSPKVVVLIATYNGEKWILEQIYSLLSQVGVQVTLLISDDYSTDLTFDLILGLSKVHDNIKILENTCSHGGAGLNFYRLIKEVNIDDFDYVALSDQDDIWDEDKLIRHIRLLRDNAADGVSSNVTAFWTDGRQLLIDKAQPQRSLDYLFESAGPGCTFLLTPWLVGKVKEQLLAKDSLAREVLLHDWLTYAVCRAYGRRWVIDCVPSVYYRQHNHNVLGANSGFKAKWARLLKVNQGWYRQEVIKVTTSCIKITPNARLVEVLNLLKSKNYFVRLRLLGYVRIARRSFLDRVFLALSILCGFL